MSISYRHQPISLINGLYFISNVLQNHADESASFMLQRKYNRRNKYDRHDDLEAGVVMCLSRNIILHSHRVRNGTLFEYIMAKRIRRKSW